MVSRCHSDVFLVHCSLIYWSFQVSSALFMLFCSLRWLLGEFTAALSNSLRMNGTVYPVPVPTHRLTLERLLLAHALPSAPRLPFQLMLYRAVAPWTRGIAAMTRGDFLLTRGGLGRGEGWCSWLTLMVRSIIT